MLNSSLFTLPLLGVVKSESEVTLKAEFSGQITNVYYKIGQFVPANSKIAEVENSAQRALLLQAERALDAAQAGYNKATGGARDEQKDILTAQTDNALKAKNQASASLANAIKDSFSSASDVIFNKISSLFSANNKNEIKSQIAQASSQSQLIIDINWKKFLLEDSLSAWQKEVTSLDNTQNLSALADTGLARLEDAKTFLDILASVINELNASNQIPQATLDGYKASVAASRLIVNSTTSALIGAKTGFNNANAAYEIAQSQLEQGFIGGDSNDILAASAGLKQAQGAYNAALSSYNKTIIKSPISGTISILNIKTGDFVSAFQTVGLVTNKGALEVSASVTEDEAKTITLASEAKINNSIPAVVTSIANALDEKTKKIEVKFAITKNDAEKTKLINGQSVQVSINRDLQPSQADAQIIIPISAIKITSDGPVVFSVNTNSELEANPVKEGAIIGDRILIELGLISDMDIVLDARGLKAGEKVIVKTQ